MSKVEIKEKTIKALLDTNELELPKFQRDLTWKDTLKQDLVTSIMNEYPIGAITLFKKDGKLFIIDGLQRLSTLKLFTDKPNKIFSWAKLNKQSYFEDIIEKIKKIIDEEEKKSEKIISGIRKWYVNDFSGNVSSLVSFSKFFEGEKLEFLEKVHNILKNFFTITDVIIPCIIYEGEWDEAAEIFENMNTGSVTLSKYEVFAAKWSVLTCEYIPEEIKKKIEERYKLIDRTVFENEESEKSNVEYNFFDYALGLSKDISDEIDLSSIVPKNKLKYHKSTPTEDKKIKPQKDEIFLELLSTLINNDLTKVEKTVSKLTEGNIVSEQLQRFLNELNSIFKDSLKEYIEYKDKKEIKKIFFYQTLYNVVKSIKLRYDICNIEFTIVKKKNIIKYDDVEQQKNDSWFENDNRQISFLRKKLDELDKFIDSSQ